MQRYNKYSNYQKHRQHFTQPARRKLIAQFQLLFSEPAAGEPSEPPPAAPFRINAGKTGMIVNPAHPYYKGASRRVAPQAKIFAQNLLKEQVRAWAQRQLIGKIFLKEGLTARFTEESLARTLREPHSQKYFQLLALLDFECLIRQASLTENPKQDWRYFSVDIHVSPSLISLQEEAEG